jgi:hypothetical protein
MNEPIKDNPTPPKRSKRKPAMEPLGWDEIVSQPGMGGYLSFLNGPVPLPHLQQSPAGATIAPEVASNPDIGPLAGIKTAPGADFTPVPIQESAAETHTVPISTPGSKITAATVRAPNFVRSPGVDLIAVTTNTPEVVSIPATAAGHRLRIRKCAVTHDGHSLGEEVLYQALWRAASTESADARTIVIGWRGMSQLCRMTPKNCKINTQRLIRKLALEILSPYNTPESIGTTYRVYSDEAILRRRRDAGLEWVVRSRGVEFVDPQTGISVAAHLCAYVPD